jgi:hypothetical protein
VELIVVILSQLSERIYPPRSLLNMPVMRCLPPKSASNSIANICEKIPGADVNVALAMGLDKHIGPLFLDAGLGYGGSFFPKDVKALIAYAKALDYTPELLDSVELLTRYNP